MGIFKKSGKKGNKDESKEDVKAGPTTKPDDRPPVSMTTSVEEANSQLPPLEQPNFKDVPASEKKALFVTKMKACQRMFVWQDGVEPGDDPQWPQKELKRQQLVSLVDYINASPKGTFDEENMPIVVEFVATNMFRPFLANPIPPHVQYDPEEDEPMLEPCWPHLQFVMEFFLRFVVNSDVDPKLAKRYIDQKFILKLIALFESEDVRERDFLKTILHRIYGKFMQHRSFIRRSINNVFYYFIYQSERHNGVAELLEILGSIINGFALPLKEEHKNFLRKVLIPLHKVKHMSIYHNQLSYCITQFCEKDQQLCPEIIRGMIRYWPQTNSPKEVLMLHELEEVLELTRPEEMLEVAPELFLLFNRCILSQHFQVAERCLFFWNNEYILRFISDNRAVVLPVVFPSLMANTRHHWNPTVYQLTINVVKMFNEMDPDLFEKCAQDFKEAKLKEEEKNNKRGEVWDKIEKKAVGSKKGSFKPVLVRTPSVLEQEFPDAADIKKMIQNNAAKNHPNMKALKESGMLGKSSLLKKN